MVTSFLKGAQAETSRVVEVDTDADGEATVTMNDLVSIDSRADVICSAVGGENAGATVQVTEVDGNDVTIEMYGDDGVPIEAADVEVAINARGY